MGRPKITITQWGISIPMPAECEPDPITAQMPDWLQELAREQEAAIVDSMMRDAFRPARDPKEPYVPPPEPPWEKLSSMACFSCGRRGVIERQISDDPELCGDHHHCTHCGVRFDLWIEP